MLEELHSDEQRQDSGLLSVGGGWSWDRGGRRAVAAFSNRFDAMAQDATPLAAAEEPFEFRLLSTVKIVTDGSPIIVAIVPKVSSVFRRHSHRRGRRGPRLGVTFEWQAPQQFDAALQVKMIEDLITSRSTRS